MNPGDHVIVVGSGPYNGRTGVVHEWWDLYRPFLVVDLEATGSRPKQRTVFLPSSLRPFAVIHDVARWEDDGGRVSA